MDNDKKKADTLNDNRKLSKQTILIADDSPENIDILRNILVKDYRLKVASNGAVALRIMESPDTPDLCLLDINMPEMNGYEVCSHLKSNIRTRSIPVMFVTAMDDVLDETRGFELGAVDYIIKPVRPLIVLARVRAHLALADQNRELEKKVRLRTAELNETRLEIIHKLGVASEYRDNETGMHIVRMSHFCRILGIAAGLTEDENELLYQAAPMHDIGKIGIPDMALLKPGKLDQKEWEVMKSHTTIGENIIGNHPSDLLRTARTVVSSHHEKWDGSGYPRGLSGMTIPKVGRIAALADVFDALTSVRPYKEAWSFDRAFSFINQHKGKDFDPDLTEVFLSKSDEIIGISQRFSDQPGSHSKLASLQNSLNF